MNGLSASRTTAGSRNRQQLGAAVPAARRHDRRDGRSRATPSISAAARLRASPATYPRRAKTPSVITGVRPNRPISAAPCSNRARSNGLAGATIATRSPGTSASWLSASGYQPARRRLAGRTCLTDSIVTTNLVHGVSCPASATWLSHARSPRPPPDAAPCPAWHAAPCRTTAVGGARPP